MAREKKSLPSRPNLDHLRKQAKTLLEDVRAGRGPAGIRAAEFRLADAQLLVARQSGFGSWPGLARHVAQLRALEGEWRFERLEVDGSVMPAAMIAQSRLLIDGDRFRTESPEANYDGVFTIDADQKPPHIDIEFVEGPEAGNHSYGLFELDGDRLILCLSVLAGGSRPASFSAKRGSGHALERLRRASAARPADVTGGTRAKAPAASAPKRAPAAKIDPRAFDAPVTPLLRRLQGDWIPTELVMDGKPMPKEWLAFGLRTTHGNEMKVTFNGQPMAHAKIRLDEHASPATVDYLNLSGRSKGSVSLGIMEWIGDEVRILMAAPGDPRPASFDTVAKSATLSRWRRR